MQESEMQHLSADYLDILLKSFRVLDYCNISIFDDNSTSKIRRNLSYYYKIPCVVLYYILLTVYLYNLVNKTIDLEELARTVSVYVICIQTVYRAVVMVSKREKIKAIILRLGSIWVTDLSSEQVVKKNALLKGLNFRYTVLSWMGFGGAWQYMLAPLLDVLFRRYILQMECALQLPFDCVYPFDATKNWFRYILTFIFESYSMFHVVYCYMGSEILLITLTSHISTQFSLLYDDLKDLDPDNEQCNDDSEIYVERNKGPSMRDLIRRHQELIKLSEDLDDIFNGIIFMNLTCATIMLSFFLLSIIIANGALQKLKIFTATLSGSYPIYNVCFHAQLLRESSEAVGDAAYQSSWYKGNKKHQMMVFSIIKRSQRPCCLTSMKYNQIALSTFRTVMSTTWSYFSLASSVYEEK